MRKINLLRRKESQREWLVCIQTERLLFRLGFRPQAFIKHEEAQLDKDISALLENNSVASTSILSIDSIMGPDSEEEDEVDDFLARE